MTELARFCPKLPAEAHPIDVIDVIDVMDEMDVMDVVDEVDVGAWHRTAPMGKYFSGALRG